MKNFIRAYFVAVLVFVFVPRPSYGQQDLPVIAVIDSGVDAQHPDLAGRLVPGYDFVDKNTNPVDRIGHGTAMAGIIVANSDGQGVGPKCLIMPLKVTNSGYVRHELIAEAIRYALKQDARVIFIGVGSTGVHPSVVSAVKMAAEAGVLVIAPFGSKELMHGFYPAALAANLPNVVSVVAVDKDDKLTYWTNTSGREVVAAPGKGILTTKRGGGTKRVSGTSAAAAYVAGVAGLVLATNPKLNARQVRQILRYGSDPLAMEGWYEYFDYYGRVNPERAKGRALSNYKDVAIERITPFPQRPLVGQEHFVRVHLVNHGNVPTDTLRLRVMSNGRLITETKLAPLGLGVAHDADISLPPSHEPTTAEVEATVMPELGETETENNSASVKIIYAREDIHDVDLVVGELSEPVQEANTITIPVTVRNRGNQNEPSVTVKLFVGRVRVVTQHFNLPIGQQALMTGSWKIPRSALNQRQTLIVRASIPSPDTHPDNNQWVYDFQVGRRADVGRLQYADTPPHTDIVMDAPWRTIRNYLPVLFFTPQFDSSEPPEDEETSIFDPLRPPNVPQGGRRIEKIELYNIDPNDRESSAELIVRDNREGADEVLCEEGVRILNPFGEERGGIVTNEEFGSFWHYIMKVRVECIGIGNARSELGTHFLWAKVKWSKPVLNMGRHHYTHQRVLRVQVGHREESKFPKFHLADRYYDIHVHTIAEQTGWGELQPLGDAAAKAFGGPIIMLLESAYAIGLVDSQLSDQKWGAFRNKIATTDHNVFYSEEPYDDGTSPASEPFVEGTSPEFGPTANTDGDVGEFQWYRENFGRLAGEEVTLESGDNQPGYLRLGHHFLTYGAPHFEGPWHGGEFLSVGISNPNTMTYVLQRMKDAEGRAPFGYAAHPYAGAMPWPYEYWNVALGFGPGFQSRTGPHVNADRTGFIFKGSQVWNGKLDEDSHDNGDLDTYGFDDMDPFTNGGPSEQAFNQNNWAGLLNHTLERYYQQVYNVLLYSFEEDRHDYFIRKVYMSAGTDAHGDFNYTDGLESTLVARFSDVGDMNSNAFGRVRTYTLTHEDETSYLGSEGSVDAYEHGRTILTDGPICKFSLDSDGRHNSTPGDRPAGGDTYVGPGSVATLRWHDSWSGMENDDGQIGGDGKFDGVRTVLVPSHGDNAWIKTLWLPSPTQIAPETTLEVLSIENFQMTLIGPAEGQIFFFRKTFDLPAGSSGTPHRRLLGEPIRYPDTDRDVHHGPYALVMEGLAGNDRYEHYNKGWERCITNPVWMVPVEIEITHPETYPIPSGQLKVIFKFPISMDPRSGVTFDDEFSIQGAQAYIRPLNSQGDSTDPEIQLQPDPGWEQHTVSFPAGLSNLVNNGKYTVTNDDEIERPEGKWDAVNHRSPGQVTQPEGSYVVYLTNLKDMHGNPLNDIARTFTLKGPARDIKLGPQKETESRYHFAIGAHAGRTIPVRDFNDTFNPQLLTELNVEYRFSRRFSFEGALGRYTFERDNADLSEYEILGGTLYLKIYQPFNGWALFVAGGPGIYDTQNPNKIEIDDTIYGVSGMVGINNSLFQWLQINVGASYFHLFPEAPDDDIDFVGIKGGLRLTF